MMAGILDEEVAKYLELALWSIPFDLVSQSTRLHVDIDRVPIHTYDKAYYVVNFRYETVQFAEFDKDIRQASIRNMHKIENKLKELCYFIKPSRYRGDVIKENYPSMTHERSARTNRLSYWLTPEQIQALYMLLKIQRNINSDE